MSKKLKQLLDHFEELLSILLLTIMAGIAFLNVAFRYLSTQSFSFTEEVVLNFFVAVTLLGISYGYKKNSHLVMGFAFDRFPHQLKIACWHLSNVLSILFFLILCYWGALQVRDEIELNSVTEALRTPTWLYSICIPLFSLLIIFRILQKYRLGANVADLEIAPR